MVDDGAAAFVNARLRGYVAPQRGRRREAARPRSRPVQFPFTTVPHPSSFFQQIPMDRATVVAVLDGLPSSADDLAALSRAADWLEVRADRIDDVDVSWLRAHFDGKLLYSLGSDCNVSRRARLAAAARDYDFVDLDTCDLVPHVLNGIPAEKRVISCRRCPADLAHLTDRLRIMSSVPARLYRIETPALKSGDEIAPLALLKNAGRRDVTAFGTGPVGLWSRIVAPWLGAPFVFGSAEADDVAQGLPSVDRLVGSFGFPDLPPIEALFGMIGDPVLHSYSPRIHNTAFRTMGYPALYVPFHVTDFPEFWRNVIANGAIEALGFSVDALSVVSPYKAVALDAAHSKSDIVGRAGSTNFFRRGESGEWIADTTDADGVLLTLRDRGVQFSRKRVAVIGCGGSGRAMAAALDQAGARVTLVNRGIERGALATRLLHLPYVPLRDFSGENYSIVVNATPVGRDSEETSFPVERLKRDTVVVDLVYRDGPTSLIRRTQGPGRVTIDGWDMLVTQAREQFRLMTGDEMPKGLARQVLGFSESQAVLGDVS